MCDEVTEQMEYFKPIYTNDCHKILDKNKRIEVKNISTFFSPFIWNIYFTNFINNERTNNPHGT